MRPQTREWHVKLELALPVGVRRSFGGLDQHRCPLVDSIDAADMFRAVKIELHEVPHLDPMLDRRTLAGRDQAVCGLGVAEDAVRQRLKSRG